MLGNVEVMQLDFEMENFTSLSVTRRINWNIDYKGQNPVPDSEKVVTELTVVQRDIQAIIPLAMVSRILKNTSHKVWNWIFMIIPFIKFRKLSTGKYREENLCFKTESILLNPKLNSVKWDEI